MKIVKLALIFVAIIGVIVGIFFIDDGGNIDPIDPIIDPRLKELNAEIENGWKERTDWDEEFFIKEHKKIDVLSRDFSVTTLRNYHTSQAVAIVHKKIFEHWSSAQCRKNNVDVYRNALTTICKTDNDANNNPMTGEIVSVYNVYSNALVLATSNFVPKSGFNGSTWKSYDSYKRDQRDAINRVLNNSHYRSSLANITAIRNGLNGAEGRMASGRTKYYENLANEIITYYTAKERTEANLQALRTVRNKFLEEYPNNSSVNSFTSRFNQEIDQ
jgi:hypothetical protein